MNALLLAILLMPTYFGGSFFTENGTHSEQLRTFTTEDGIALTELAFPTYTSAGAAIGYAQGPRPIRNPGFFPRDGTLHNGFLYMAHSETSDATGFVQTKYQSIARSADGATWTPYYQIDFSSVTKGGGPLNTVWAPRWFKDLNGDIYIVTAARNSTGTGTNGSAMDCYYTKALNSTLNSWTTPALIGGIPTGTTVGGPNYDPEILLGEDGLTYFCSYVNGGDGSQNTWIYKSTTSPVSGYTAHLTGGWTFQGFNGRGFPAGHDSPTWRKFGSTWRLYIDNFGNSPRGVYYADIEIGDWQINDNQGHTGPQLSIPTRMLFTNSPTDVRAIDLILNPFNAATGSFANVFASVIR